MADAKDPAMKAHGGKLATKKDLDKIANPMPEGITVDDLLPPDNNLKFYPPEAVITPSPAMPFPPGPSVGTPLPPEAQGDDDE